MVNRVLFNRKIVETKIDRQRVKAIRDTLKNIISDEPDLAEIQHTFFKGGFKTANSQKNLKPQLNNLLEKVS
jgi:hypothetical protein